MIPRFLLDYFMGLFEIVIWRMTLQYQPMLSSITNVAPGGSANQIAVLNYLHINTLVQYIVFLLY